MKFRQLALIPLVFAFATIGLSQSTPSIRKVDFKNFNYGSLCSGPHTFFSPPAENLVLKAGHQDHGDEMNYADLRSVRYVDLNGDGRDEAFVVVHGQTAGSSNDYVVAYVFNYERGRARQVWTLCEENSTAELKGKALIFTSPEWLKNDAHCCFSHVATRTYAWKGKGLTLISTKRKKNK
ncbi:MAG: hypothetical protein ABIV21_00730 [Pyrinomonadaceae bacterium]